MTTLERLLKSFPAERENLRPYVDRAKAYHNECGCSTGGAFMVVSLGLVITRFVIDGIRKGEVLVDLFWGTLFVFSASLIGKLIGIGVARIRLALLYRHLHRTYPMRDV
ncbi:MAG TPA: hypothetical protein VES88_12300 [Gemmatimonadaceae bacterium]|nr:hypothetical protein [Gemmatimonadaceae bacterium]